jgi:hypothetical protein
MTLNIEDDFAYLAVVDAYRWWINHDFGFLIATKVIGADGARTGRTVGEYDFETMRRIARAYSVSRNIPSHDSEVEGEKVVKHLNGEQLRHLSKLGFEERAKGLVEFVKTNRAALRLAPDAVEPKRRALASALSKLTWFLNPEDWTIFDKYVSAAVLRRGGAGVDQMEKFYGDLSKGWPDTLRKVEQEVVGRGLDQWLASRIVDKYLFYHGVGMFEMSDDGKQRLVEKATLAEKLRRPAVVSMRQSLLASGKVLRASLGGKLDELAHAIAPILKETNWTKERE